MLNSIHLPSETPTLEVPPARRSLVEPWTLDPTDAVQLGGTVLLGQERGISHAACPGEPVLAGPRDPGEAPEPPRSSEPPSVLTMECLPDPVETTLSSSSAAARASARADLEERLGPLQTEVELSGPVQGPLRYLLACSLDPLRAPDPEIPLAVRRLESELVHRPLTDPVLRTIVGLLDRPHMAPELVPLLRRWHSQGRVQVDVDLCDPTTHSRVAVQAGRLTCLPRSFETWQLRSMSEQQRQPAVESAVKALHDCPDYVNMWLLDWVEDPEFRPLVEPYREIILAMPAFHEQRGVPQPVRSDLIVGGLLKEGPEGSPEALRRSLGSMLRMAPDENVYLTLQAAIPRFGASWALEQLAHRSPALPVTGLWPALHEPLAVGNWWPVRSDVDVLISRLQLPRTESLMDGPRAAQFRDGVRLLEEVGRAQPGLLEGWEVHGRDFRDDLLERVVTDPPERAGSSTGRLSWYEPIRDRDGLASPQALAALLLEGPGGEARADRCLRELGQGLARLRPDQALDGRELRLCGLLTTARLSQASQERLDSLMQGWRHRFGKDQACDSVLRDLAQRELYGSLRGLSPEAVLARRTELQRDLAGILQPETVNALVLVRLADAASSDPQRELSRSTLMLTRWIDAATTLLPAFEDAVREGRLPALYADLETLSRRFGPYEGAQLVGAASPEGVFDPARLARIVEERTGVA
ncbi:MAG: hypothetical protein AB1758_20935 [Candidatus Eremiobacterota bacterium]